MGLLNRITDFFVGKKSESWYIAKLEEFLRLCSHGEDTIRRKTEEIKKMKRYVNLKVTNPEFNYDFDRPNWTNSASSNDLQKLEKILESHAQISDYRTVSSHSLDTITILKLIYEALKIKQGYLDKLHKQIDDIAKEMRSYGYTILREIVDKIKLAHPSLPSYIMDNIKAITSYSREKVIVK